MNEPLKNVLNEDGIKFFSSETMTGQGIIAAGRSNYSERTAEQLMLLAHNSPGFLVICAQYYAERIVEALKGSDSAVILATSGMEDEALDVRCDLLTRRFPGIKLAYSRINWQVLADASFWHTEMRIGDIYGVEAQFILEPENGLARAVYPRYDQTDFYRLRFSELRNEFDQLTLRARAKIELPGFQEFLDLLSHNILATTVLKLQPHRDKLFASDPKELNMLKFFLDRIESLNKVTPRLCPLTISYLKMLISLPA